MVRKLGTAGEGTCGKSIAIDLGVLAGLIGDDVVSAVDVDWSHGVHACD